MTDISFVVDESYQNNRIFDSNDPTRVKYYRLKEAFEKQGFCLNTCDNYNKNVKIAIYFDIPDNFLEIYDPNIQNYALLIESPLIKPNNFNHTLYKYFDKIFTWSNDLLRQNNNNKFIKINYSFEFKFDRGITSILHKKKKLCSLIISNKSSKFKNELYSKRREVIRWFEKNHPYDFNLYGRGWNECQTGNPLIKRLVKFIPLKDLCLKIRGNFFSSYRGKVDNKITTLSNYKFTIAFENIQDVPGYITEKSFDAFFSGCVPIYLGANDILDVIPKNCFIDMRDFNTYDELYRFINSMSDEQYHHYLENINDFLSSTKSQCFTINTFVKTIVHGVLVDVSNIKK